MFTLLSYLYSVNYSHLRQIVAKLFFLFCFLKALPHKFFVLCLGCIYKHSSLHAQQRVAPCRNLRTCYTLHSIYLPSHCTRQKVVNVSFPILTLHCIFDPGVDRNVHTLIAITKHTLHQIKPLFFVKI